MKAKKKKLSFLIPVSLTWKKVNSVYGPVSYKGLLGKWCVFTINWNSMRPRVQATEASEQDYILRCSLPGIKPRLGDFSLSDAKQKAEQVLGHWLGGCEL